MLREGLVYSFVPVQEGSWLRWQKICRVPIVGGTEAALAKAGNSGPPSACQAEQEAGKGYFLEAKKERLGAATKMTLSNTKFPVLWDGG